MYRCESCELEQNVFWSEWRMLCYLEMHKALNSTVLFGWRWARTMHPSSYLRAWRCQMAGDYSCSPELHLKWNWKDECIFCLNISCSASYWWFLIVVLVIKSGGGSWHHSQSLNFSEELKLVDLTGHDESLLWRWVEKLIFNFLFYFSWSVTISLLWLVFPHKYESS